MHTEVEHDDVIRQYCSMTSCRVESDQGQAHPEDSAVEQYQCEVHSETCQTQRKSATLKINGLSPQSEQLI